MADFQKSKLKEQDAAILRMLAEEKARYAREAVNAERARLWGKLNELQSERPMVWITEIPWHEMNVDDELTLRCEDPWARQQEEGLRRELYTWRHMQGDMIINEYMSCPLVIYDSGFGIDEEVDVVKTDEASTVVSRHFHIQIKEFEDLDKIKLPVIEHDTAASAAQHERMQAVYGDIMPVRKEGVKGIWYTPWDNLIRWWGVEEAMMDMVLRPELVHAGVERTVQSCMSRLDQLEKFNLLALNTDNTRVGSGGYGYTSQLPGQDFDAACVKPMDMWGCSNAQIFSEISPEMHWEFAVKHDLPWLARWGLVYYGCCEPLDLKMDVLRRIPNLRKVSMSPWIKPERASKAVGDDYVFSYKPNPAIFAEGTWREDVARKELVNVLDKTRGCHVELIMKDISTVQYKPQRLWKWAKLCSELTQDYAC